MGASKRWIAFSLTLGLGIWVAGVVAAERIDDTYIGFDDKCDDADEDIVSSVSVDLDGSEFEVEGRVQGTGTSGDVVAITYATTLVTRVDFSKKKGTVEQREDSEICVFIQSEDEGRDADVCVDVPKCRVKGVANVLGNGRAKIDAEAKCNGRDLYEALNVDQVNSVLAAFPERNKCGIKLKVSNAGAKSSLWIKLRDKSGEVLGTR